MIAIYETMPSISLFLAFFKKSLIYLPIRPEISSLSFKHIVEEVTFVSILILKGQLPFSFSFIIDKFSFV